MYTLANSEDPEEMLHSATFHQHRSTLFAKTKRNKKYDFLGKI